MLNVNVQKIAQARKSLLAQQQFDTAVAEIEAYFNDEQNFLKSELSVDVTLTETNYQRLLPLLHRALGIYARAHELCRKSPVCRNIYARRDRKVASQLLHAVFPQSV